MNTKTYEINSSTCALIPKNDFSTIILDNDGVETIPNSINKLMNYSCAYYGSSLKGRLEGTKQALGSKYKLPIIVEETREMIFFPTSSYRDNKCAWISLKNISNYKKSGKNVKVLFKNNQVHKNKLKIDLN